MKNGIGQKQKIVEKFIQENEMSGTIPFRIIDLFAEAGEIAADAAKSAEYGDSQEELEVKEDEFGDVLFSLFAIANDLDVDLDEAFEKAMKKYRSRIEEKGDPGSE